MFDIDKWREIWATLSANPLRTLLTALGVFWGMLMLMIMLMFSSALVSGVQKQMNGISSNALFVWGGVTTEAYEGLQPGRRVQFEIDDMEPLKHVAGLDTVAPRIQLGGFMTPSKVTYNNKTASFHVMGDFPDIIKVVTLLIKQGRFLNERDITDARKICIIGNAVAEQMLPPGTDPIGSWLQINGVYFRVVGLTKTLRSGNLGDRDDNSIFVPFTAFRAAFHTGDKVGFFALTAKDDADGPQLETDIKTVLGRRHRVAPTDQLAINSFNAFVFFRKTASIFIAINTMMWIVGVLTLLAGVIGVTNIMLITVKERTKEFGVRKALGANPISVIVMVMKESIVLTSAAGIFGIVAGIGVMALLVMALENAGPKFPFGAPNVALSTVGWAFGILVTAGAFAGIIPAYHAASIKPVEALRAE
ncbi:MAG TPA: ABC transporter permease [Kofleriaceae bacterium]|nr:ABC transporter permease [Kofleriaceae bacterium]